MRSLCGPLILTAFAFAFPICAHAESYDPTTLTASEIINNARNATGAREAGDFKEVQLERNGGIDWTLTTVWRDNNVKTVESGAGFVSSSGRYRNQSWRQNDNGILTILSNFHSQEDVNGLALSHPEDPKSNVRVLGITQSEPHQYGIEVHPQAGNDVFRYYDVKTSLLAQTVSFTADRYRHVTEFSDYRKTFGTMVAYHIRSQDGRPQNDTDWTVTSYTKADAGDDAAMPAPASLFTYAGDKPLQLPAKFTRGGIVVDLAINGHTMSFILDSGASGLVIDPGAAARAGLTPVGRYTTTIGGNVDIGRVRVPHVTFGQLSLDNVVFRTSAFDRTLDDGSRVVGLVGFDMLASGIFGIDLKAQTLTLYPREHFDPQAMGLLGVGLQLDDGVPRTELSIEGVHGHFMVDTGSFKMLAYKQFVDKLPSAVTETSRSRITAVGGSVSSSVIDVTNIIFGGVKYNTGQMIEPNTSTFNASDYDGLIGRDMLYNYRAYFDYGDGMLFLKETL